MSRDPLDQDPIYGIGEVSLNFTVYDRPQYAFANVLRGDVDGVTRALLSPSTLSPSQIKSVRDVLMPSSSKPNPLIKTVTDIATNPLVIVGLLVGLKYPLGSTKPLLDLRKGLLPKSAAMGSMMSGLHDAMMNLRTIPGMFENLLGVTKSTADFILKHGDEAQKAFSRAGKLSKAEGLAVAARLDGLHTADHYMVKALRNEPEWVAFMGGKDVPIAPGIQSKMTASQLGLSDRLRRWYDDVRAVTTKNPKIKERMKHAVESQGLQFGEDVTHYFPHRGSYNPYYLQSMRGATGTQYRKWLREQVGKKVGKEQVQRMGGMFANVDDLRKLEEAGVIRSGFVDMVESIQARQARQSAEAVQGIWSSIRKAGMDEAQERVAFVKKMREYYTTGAGKKTNLIGRLGGKRVVDDTLDAMAGALQTAEMTGAESIGAELAKIGETLAKPSMYSLNPWEGSAQYLRSVASGYAWHGTGLGEKIMKTIRTPGVFREAPYLESYLTDDLIPHIRGVKSFKEMQRSLAFSVQKEKVANWIKNTPYVESALGTKGKNWLLNYFGRGPTGLTAEGMAGSISHWFYLSTLGANVSPASKNLLQNIITTMNVPGIGPAGLARGMNGVAGFEGAMPKIRRYLESLAKGTEHSKAFRAAFPEYVADMGDASHIVESLMAGDSSKEGLIAAFRQGGTWDKVKKGLMLPFSTSEGFNRILGYYAGRNSHIFHNAGTMRGASEAVRSKILKEAGQVGQTLTMMSHFSGGPLGAPKAIMNVPSPFRQFLHFPLRNLGFLQGSLRLGKENNLDWGTIGRVMAGSTVTYLTARNLLGVDLSSGLAAGALPVPAFEGAPFYPFPLVPPVVGVAGSLGKAVLQGDPSRLGSTAALLVPGGLAGRRAYRQLSPKYADYENPTQDGRIPVYDHNRALVGAYTPMQMALRTMGIQSSSAEAERGAAQWIMSQRDRIRGYRRDYLEALAQNDSTKAEKINGDFQKAYPEFGPLQVKKSDIRAIENRKERSRLQRILRGMPTDYRPLFEQVVSEASAGSVVEDMQSSDLGLIPQYLGQ